MSVCIKIYLVTVTRSRLLGNDISKMSIPISKRIDEYITSAALEQVFKGKYSDKFLKTLDYQAGPLKNDPSGASWTLQLTSSFPPKKQRSEIICLFPNHDDKKKCVLRASSYLFLDNFNKAINTAFKSSLPETEYAERTKVAFVYGNCVFKCKEIEGTIYLVYAEYICRVNQGNVPNTGYEQCPLIINCDGQNNIKSIFILKPDVKSELDLWFLPHAPGNPIVRRPRDPIFVCETRPPEVPTKQIITLSRTEALKRITMHTKDPRTWGHFQKNAFVKDLDDDELEVDGFTWSEHQDMSLETVTDSPIQGELALIKEGTAVERDPFEDDDADDDGVEDEHSKGKLEIIV